jgi:hypothetical protein
MRFFANPVIIYYTLFLIWDVLAITKSYFFFSFHLVDIILHVRTLKYVLTALTARPFQMGATMFFGVVIIYLFAITGFMFFRQDYNFGEVAPPTRHSSKQSHP